jgi:hypothetical protein
LEAAEEYEVQQAALEEHSEDEVADTEAPEDDEEPEQG